MAVRLTSTVAREQQLDRPRARPWEQHGSIDIEQLAQWAYGVQMVDRFERSGLHAIEAAAAGYEVRGFSACGVGQLMQINHLGCRVDKGGAIVSDAVHPVAYALAQVLRGIDGGELVRSHALAGSRPTSWRPPVHRIQPAMWDNSGREAVVEYHGPGRKGAHCNLRYVWDEGREAWGRAVYSRWWAALEELAWRMSQRRLGFMVTGPAASLEPWQAGGPTPHDGSSQAAQT